MDLLLVGPAGKRHLAGQQEIEGSAQAVEFLANVRRRVTGRPLRGEVIRRRRRRLGAVAGPEPGVLGVLANQGKAEVADLDAGRAG